MNMLFRVAIKNVFRQKKRSFTLGVNYAIVTFILVLLFSFSQGARVNITSNLVRSSAGHITISGQYIVSGRVYNGLLRTPEIIATTRRTLGADTQVLPRYLLSSAVYYKGLSKRLSFVGIDTGMEQGFRDQITFVAGDWQGFVDGPNAVIIPQATAEYFGLGYDDEVLISTRTRFGAFNTGTLKIKGIYTTNNFFIQNQVLAHLEFLRALDLAPEDAASTLYVYLPSTSGLADKRDRLIPALESIGFEVSKPKNDTEAVAAITAASPRYELDKEGRDRVRLTLATIDEVLGLVRNILNAVNGVGTLIAAIMLFIIAVSIFINLRMSINERLREIGTLRTIGMAAGGVTGLFMLESILLALIFSLIGTGVALGAAALLRFVIVLPLSGNAALFLNQGHLMLVPRVTDILMIIAIITCFSALFSFFPARRGGKIRPVEALTRVF
jgi:ABC-type lipoprotein release transport system permease subunit